MSKDNPTERMAELAGRDWKAESLFPKRVDKMAKHWNQGEEPDQCSGNCHMGGVTEPSCLTCGWQQPEPES